MKKYFYSDGANSIGPFTLEELKEKGITRETKVWYHELGDWKKAGTVQELNELFTLIPPALPQQTVYSQEPIRPASNVIDILVFLSIAYWFIINLASFIIQRVIENWYDSPAKYFQIFTNIIFAFIPIVFAISVKNKVLKVISIILSAFLSIYFLYNNIDWLLKELK